MPAFMILYLPVGVILWMALDSTRQKQTRIKYSWRDYISQSVQSVVCSNQDHSSKSAFCLWYQLINTGQLTNVTISVITFIRGYQYQHSLFREKWLKSTDYKLEKNFETNFKTFWNILNFPYASSHIPVLGINVNKRMWITLWLCFYCLKIIYFEPDKLISETPRIKYSSLW